MHYHKPWDTDGQILLCTISQKVVLCVIFCCVQNIHLLCSLQDVRPRQLPPTPELRALEIITYVGLAISILCLLITIVTYLVSR